MNDSNVMIELDDQTPDFRNGFAAAILWLAQGDSFSWSEIPNEKDYLILKMKDGGLGNRTYRIENGEPRFDRDGCVV